MRAITKAIRVYETTSNCSWKPLEDMVAVDVLRCDGVDIYAIVDRTACSVAGGAIGRGAVSSSASSVHDQQVSA